MNTPALHWYDLTCPFCYLAQTRNTLLTEKGFTVTELPFQAHPDIPKEGIYIGPRKGPLYTSIEQQAAEAGLPLHWQDKLPNSRLALMAAEWTRQNQPEAFPGFQHALFNAHFAAGRDIGNTAVILEIAKANAIPAETLEKMWTDGTGETAVKASEDKARQAGVRGTPAWLIEGRLIEGLQPASWFGQLSSPLTDASSCRLA